MAAVPARPPGGPGETGKPDASRRGERRTLLVFADTLSTISANSLAGPGSIQVINVSTTRAGGAADISTTQTGTSTVFSLAPGAPMVSAREGGVAVADAAFVAARSELADRYRAEPRVQGVRLAPDGALEILGRPGIPLDGLDVPAELAGFPVRSVARLLENALAPAATPLTKRKR